MKMIQCLSFIVFFCFMANCYANLNQMDDYVDRARECHSLDCVREHIDDINSQIVILLAQRFAYVQRAGELKPDDISVCDAKRETSILKNVAVQAQQIGLPANIAVSVFKEILRQANQYEALFH